MSLPVLRACTPMPVVRGPVTPAIVRASIDRDGNMLITAAERRRSARMRPQWLDSNRESNVDLAQYRAGFGSPQR